jgi:ankyrin repeat protein
MLLSAGADIDRQAGEFGNALQAATVLQQERVVKLLIGRGADVNDKGAKWGTALQAASHVGNGAIVTALLDAGADLFGQGEVDIGNAFALAESAGHVGVLEIMDSWVKKDLNLRAKAMYFYLDEPEKENYVCPGKLPGDERSMLEEEKAGEKATPI